MLETLTWVITHWHGCQNFKAKTDFKLGAASEVVAQVDALMCDVLANQATDHQRPREFT